MAGGEAFDMFASEPSFSSKFARVLSSFPADPPAIYAALVVGACIEAGVIAGALSAGESEIGPSVMADAMKFVILSLGEATAEELVEIVGVVLETAGDDSEDLLTDPMKFVASVLASESDDEDEEDAYEDAVEAAEDDGEDEDAEEESEEDADEDAVEAEEESEDDDVCPAKLYETVRAKIGEWDEWFPDDEILRALKCGFADACVLALERAAEDDL